MATAWQWLRVVGSLPRFGMHAFKVWSTWITTCLSPDCVAVENVADLLHSSYLYVGLYLSSIHAAASLVFVVCVVSDLPKLAISEHGCGSLHTEQQQVRP